MVKKWLHIFLSVWLINSVSYAQINNIPQPGHHCSQSSALNSDSWADFFLESIATDKPLSSDKQHHTKQHRRFVHVSTNQFNGYLAVVHFLYQPYNFSKKIVKKSISPYLIGIALLPAYYAFLFRLSPF